MLTPTQQVQVLDFLGWPGKTLVAGQLEYNSIISARFQSTSTDQDTLAVAYINRLVGIDTQLQAALSRLTALQIGDIKVNPDEIPALRRERKRVIRQLSDLMDIDLNAQGGVNVNVIA